MVSGRVLEWLKKEGETVSRGEPVVRIETEKVTLEVEAPETGSLEKILVNPSDENVPVGTVLGSIRAKGESPGGALTSVTAQSTKSTTLSEAKSGSPLSRDIAETETKLPSPGGARVSPSARRLAREMNVDLGQVVGTGPNGRITGEDVEKYSESVSIKSDQSVESTSFSRSSDGRGKIKQQTSMRKAIGDKMYESWTRIPQVPLFLEVKLSEVEKQMNDLAAASKRRISFTAAATKALALALKQFPELNARYEADGVYEFEHVDVSIAVALDDGLITPVVRGADQMTLAEISSDIEELSKKARSNSLSPADVRGGTTSISNLGGYQVDWFIPIINPPQATILGIGRARESKEVGRVRILTLVFDHRITDGARAAKLLEKIRDLIENPDLLH